MGLDIQLHSLWILEAPASPTSGGFGAGFARAGSTATKTGKGIRRDRSRNFKTTLIYLPDVFIGDCTHQQWRKNDEEQVQP